MNNVTGWWVTLNCNAWPDWSSGGGFGLSYPLSGNRPTRDANYIANYLSFNWWQFFLRVMTGLSQEL
ncbi:hypothetical protein O9992_16275 [Vibrio lentus]|nr:hypothetical protein [Vibrio lentus]